MKKSVTGGQEKKARLTELVRKQAPKTNVTVAKIMLIFSAISFSVWLLFQFDVLKSKSLFVYVALLLIPVLFVVAGVYCIIRRGKGKAFPYVFVVLLALFWLALEMMSGYKSRMLLPLLLVVSLRYYNKKFTFFTLFTCICALLASVFLNAYLYQQTGFLDLNLVRLEQPYTLTLSGFMYDNIILLSPDSSMLLKNGLILVFAPNVLFLSLITFLAIRFMSFNLSNMLAAEEASSKDAEQKLEIADMKTKVMLSQVKPHFVYNTLSSIASLCTADPQKAKKLTLDFSTYLRNNLDTLNRNDVTFCSFETEREHIESYLNIELVRFEDELNVVLDTPDTFFSVPVLSIQPLVENAVKHGLSRKVGGGTVTIKTREVSNGHEVIISDDGVGFDPEKALNDGKEHIGLSNVKKRLSLIGGSLSVESAIGVGTTVTVFIPSEEGLR